MGLKRGTVKLEKHNNNWKDDFNIEKDNLEKLFGDVALKIEHIGSTSLNEIMAKPIIDIAVGLRSLDDFKKVENNFKNYPYSIKEDSVTDEILVRKEQNECIMYLIHVMEIESKRYIDTIVFRDYLIENPNRLKEYEKLKIQLAKKYADNRVMYTMSKAEFIQNTLKMAYCKNWLNKYKVNNIIYFVFFIKK